jgi:F-type H+-transporting ATPase subunit epsilon
MHLRVVTPQGAKLETEVSAVTVPGALGDMGILPGHQPLLTSLRVGTLSYTVKGQTGWLAINGGYMEVADNDLIVITETAEAPSDVDLERAKKALAAAIKEIAGLDATRDEAMATAEASRQRAENRIAIAQKADRKLPE